jgi:hypothetical protein
LTRQIIPQESDAVDLGIGHEIAPALPDSGDVLTNDWRIISVIQEFLGTHMVGYLFAVICVEASSLGGFALSRSSLVISF